jgi:hypothetical protein
MPQFVREKAVRKTAIAIERGYGTSDESAAIRLVYTGCRRRFRTATGTPVRSSA